MSRPTIRTAIFAGTLALGLAANAGAAQLVTFTRGQSIVVQAAEKRGSWYYFTLDGGGQMGVPVKQVVRMEEYDMPPAAAAPQAGDTPAPARITPVPEPQPSAAPAMGSNASGAPPPDANGVDPGAAGAPPAPSPEGAGAVAPAGDDWRSRVKMGPGARNQAAGRKQGGMGGFGGRAPGAVNPFNRRPPNKPPQQPDPPQQ